MYLCIASTIAGSPDTTIASKDMADMAWHGWHGMDGTAERPARAAGAPADVIMTSSPQNLRL